MGLLCCSGWQWLERAAVGAGEQLVRKPGQHIIPLLRPSLTRCSIDPERRIVLKDGTVLYGDPSLRGAAKRRK